MVCFNIMNLAMEKPKESTKRTLPSLQFSKRHYILTIGDDGAIIVYMRGDTLEHRFFAALSSPADIEKMLAILAQDPKAPLSIIVDIMDQTYVQHSLPAVSALNIGKLVNKKLERDFPADNLKGVIQLDRSKTGRKDWNYLFIACPTISPVSDWIELVINLPNRLTGIYLLPIELGAFVDRLQKDLVPAKPAEDAAGTPKATGKSRWQIIVTHNKVGGFRQAAYKDGKIVFTRLVNATAETSADIIAGNIEQELLNTLEYLRRLSFQESDGYDVTILVSPDIKQSLSTSAIKGNNVSLLSPHDVANKLHLINAASPDDRFADVVVAAYFAKAKHVLKLHTPVTEKLYAFSNMNKWLNILFISLPILLVITLWMGISSYFLSDTIEKLELDKKNIQSRWQAAQKDTFSIQDALKINDIVSLYKLLSGAQQTPLSLIADFNTVKGNDALVKNILWELAAENKSAPKKEDEVKIIFELEFANAGASFEVLFANFESFIKRLEDKFSNYNVEYSRLPEKITFGDKNQAIPISVTISGPKAKTSTNP